MMIRKDTYSDPEYRSLDDLMNQGIKHQLKNRFSLRMRNARLGALLTTILALYGCGYFYSTADETVIVVGSTHLDSNTLKKDVRFISSELETPFHGDSRIKEKLIDRVIDHYLILEFGKKNGIAVSQQEFEANLREIKKQYTEESFREALLQAYVNEGQWETRFRESLLIRRICAKAMEKVPEPGYEEAKRFFEKNRDIFEGQEQIRFLQIVTRTEEEAVDLHGRIQRGEDFMDLARKYSITPEGTQGGSVGWINREHLDQALQEAFSNTLPGQLGPLVKTPFGYHLVRLLDTRTTDQAIFEDIYPKVLNVLTLQKRNRYYSHWLKELRSEFQIKVNQKLLKQVEFS